MYQTKIHFLRFLKFVICWWNIKLTVLLRSKLWLLA